MGRMRANMVHTQSTILFLLAAILSVDAAPIAPFLKHLLANCTADNTCAGVSTDNCCSGKSYKTNKCGQELQCNFCKKAVGLLEKELQNVPDCSKLNLHGICEDIVIGPVTILCEPLLYALCNRVLNDIKKGISDPAQVCAQAGSCGTVGAKCGCLPDGTCHAKGDAQGCCNGNVHKVIQASCMSGSRCGCRSDGECLALGGPATDCCSGKAHHTAACTGGKRCGCLPDGSCLAVNGGAVTECCSGVGHFTSKCAGLRMCGPKLGDIGPDQRVNPAPPPVFDCRSVTDKTTCDAHSNPPFDQCGWCSTSGSNGTWSGCLPEYEIKKLPPSFKCGSAPTPTPHCSDASPGSHSCAEQKAWGKCGEKWMKGHCCKTCFGCHGCM